MTNIPKSKRGLLSTAFYAAWHPSFYHRIMCSLLKHVWVRNDEWLSIQNRCAEMWQGQTMRSAHWRIWIFNLGLCSCGITIHHMSPGSHWLWKLDYRYRNNNVHDFAAKYRLGVKEKCIFRNSVKVCITQQWKCWTCKGKSVRATRKHVDKKSILHLALTFPSVSKQDKSHRYWMTNCILPHSFTDSIES